MSPTLVSAAARAVSTPTFTDPAALVTWLIKSNNGRGFQFVDDAATAPVFSPGLRSALLASLTRSRQRNEPPWGADGDIILDTQEDGRHGTGCSPSSEPLRTGHGLSIVRRGRRPPEPALHGGQPGWGVEDREHRRSRRPVAAMLAGVPELTGSPLSVLAEKAGSVP